MDVEIFISLEMLMVVGAVGRGIIQCGGPFQGQVTGGGRIGPSGGGGVLYTREQVATALCPPLYREKRGGSRREEG